jgi:hypothetical protein
VGFVIVQKEGGRHPERSRGLSQGRSRHPRTWAELADLVAAELLLHGNPVQQLPLLTLADFVLQSEKALTPDGHPAREQLFLVPEDRQCDQSDRNNPQNDVFAAALFLGHMEAVQHIRNPGSSAN